MGPSGKCLDEKAGVATAGDCQAEDNQSQNARGTGGTIRPAGREVAGTAYLPAGSCWVMQWMLPPPKATSRVWTPTICRSGNICCSCWMASWSFSSPY